MEYSKRWYQSRTLWFNLTTLIVSLSGASMQFTNKLGLTDSQATTAALVLTLITVFGNSMLRMITTKSIK